MDPVKEMSVKEAEVMVEFRKRIADLLPKFKSDFYRQDLALLRFLRARDLNLNKAETMLRNHMTWRAENDVDSIQKNQVPPQFFQEFPVKICGTDKEGYPVGIAPIGKWDFRSAVESGLKDEFILFVCQWIERGADIVERLTTNEKFYFQVCLVFDFEGFAYTQLASKTVISVILELVKIFEANYPEVLRVIWVVNAPAIFSVLWGLVKPFLTDRTTSKIRIHGSNRNKWRADILSMVDEDNLSSIYGGSNTTCPDFNIEQGFDVRKISPSYKIFPVEDRKRVLVGPGQTHTVDVKANIGEKINWNFLTDSCDIIFGVEFNKTEDIIKPCRVDSHLCLQKGFISCEKSGLYTLTFDNTYSSFTGKSLGYIVRKS
ncbi:unnamed protein product [Allacma fusca]|uniref:SEC14-like protein 2 n=1 Tax=Allacma fusca TaxID=39272 RepID=A0A8J2NWM2_9HEXA|nr:unnamed protein product [Allacma fusca]